MTARLKTYTLGCKVNQYETQYVREGLLSIGYQDAAPVESADLCVVNTCTVTNEGDAKSRQIIRRMARENPAARIVVMGCYATRAPEEIAALPGVSEVITDKRELPDLLGRFGVVDLPTGISGFSGRSRAYVKVQDGCLLRCSYCIIPHVRPHVNSRPIEHIVEEVTRLVNNGYREIVLTGVHLGHYGVEGNWNKPKSQWVRLADLVRTLAELPGEFRLRLSSIESTEVTRELITVMQQNPEKICPHLHVCLQSGSDAVLGRMRRRWSAKSFVDRCRLVQLALELPALTTDVIVGFPGETDVDFEQTRRVAQEVGFSKIHIFPFSPRRGTPAAEMPDQVPTAERNRRRDELINLEVELRRAYYQKLLGRRLRVLIESTEESSGYESPTFQGTSCRYAPIEVAVDSSTSAKCGELVEVEANGIVEGKGTRIVASLTPAMC